ncbi:MAG: hypothetical protein ACD_73C00348G0004 [uncultured bacterium]|nr:MAG: hypothetical protein ACD_73C00348G0004 [uncultured bacterium]
MVHGMVQNKDIFRHPLMICRLFGPRFYIKCLALAIFNPRSSTFLELLRMKDHK